MVSHCQTVSKREVIVNKLKSVTNLTIEIYGKCADKEHRLPPETTGVLGMGLSDNFAISVTITAGLELRKVCSLFRLVADPFFKIFPYFSLFFY